VKLEKIKKLTGGSQANVTFVIKILILVVCAIFFEIATRGIFLSSRNATLLLRQTAINGVLATGMVYIIVSGNIDLSIGSGVAMTGAILAVLQTWHQWGTVPSILVVLLVGICIGLFHGFWIIRDVPAFVVTLGTMLVFRGLALLITKGVSIAPLTVTTKQIGQGFVPIVPSIILFIAIFVFLVIRWFIARAKAKSQENVTSKKPKVMQLVSYGILVVAMIYVVSGYKGLPIPVLIMMGLMVVMWFLSKFTAFGRNVYAVGGNAEASRYSGINVKRVTFIVVLIMGVFTSIGGILLSARLDGAMPAMGSLMEMDAISAAIIGGCSLAGGSGTIWGALFGALFMAALDNGMSLLNIGSFMQYIVKGLIIIIAVYSDVSANKRK